MKCQLSDSKFALIFDNFFLWWSLSYNECARPPKKKNFKNSTRGTWSTLFHQNLLGYKTAYSKFFWKFCKQRLLQIFLNEENAKKIVKNQWDVWATWNLHFVRSKFKFKFVRFNSNCIPRFFLNILNKKDWLKFFEMGENAPKDRLVKKLSKINARREVLYYIKFNGI